MANTLNGHQNNNYHKMDWKDLIKTEPWASLSTISDTPTHVYDLIYKIGHQQYVLAHKTYVDQPTQTRMSNGGPFVPIAIWAIDDEHAIKSHRSTSIINPHPITEIAPQELLLGTEGRYGQLHKKSRLDGGGLPPTRGVINGKTGEFSHVIIDLGLFTYCYFTPNPKMDDLPFAIQLRLSQMKYYPIIA